MTRQKKEIRKKIDEIREFIDVDYQLGCGFAPAGAYDDMYEEIYKLEEQLAGLSGYKSVEEMMYDNRWMTGKTIEALPFM